MVDLAGNWKTRSCAATLDFQCSSLFLPIAILHGRACPNLVAKPRAKISGPNNLFLWPRNSLGPKQIGQNDAVSFPWKPKLRLTRFLVPLYQLKAKTYTWSNEFKQGEKGSWRVCFNAAVKQNKPLRLVIGCLLCFVRPVSILSRRFFPGFEQATRCFGFSRRMQSDFFCTQPGKDEVPKSEPLQRDDEEISESHVQKPAACFKVKRTGIKMHYEDCCFTTMIQLDCFLLPPVRWPRPAKYCR